MLVLLGFALLAGAGTALSPCVLPVLPRCCRPAASAGAAARWASSSGLVDHVHGHDRRRGQGRRRRRARQRPAARSRDRVLLGFGLALLVPRCERAAGGAALAAGAASGPATRGDGFLSGLARRRRAGLRLHALREPDPRGGDLGQRGLRPHGRDRARLRGRLGARAARAHARRPARCSTACRRAGRGPALQRALGVVMVAHRGGDHHQPRCQLRPVRRPAHPRRQPHRGARVLAAPSPGGCTRSPGASRSSRRPTAPRRCGGSGEQAAGRAARTPARRRCSRGAAMLPDLGAAPEFTDTQRWFNTPGGRPLSLASLRGRVVLVDFWTYTCINCIRTLPYLKAWDAALPPRRADDRRRAHARVRLRARRRQRRQRDRAVRAALSGRPGQRHGHLERLRQPVLAGRLPDRRAAATCATRPSARATTTRPKRRSARCSPRPAPRVGGARPPARRDRALAAARRPRPTSAPSAREGWFHGPYAGRARLRAADQRPAGAQRASPTAAPGTSPPSRRSRSRAPTSTSSSRPRTCTWCSARPGGRPRPVQVLLDGRPISARAGRRRRARRQS